MNAIETITETMGYKWCFPTSLPDAYLLPYITIRLHSGELMIYCRIEMWGDNQGNGGSRTVPVLKTEVELVDLPDQS